MWHKFLPWGEIRSFWRCVKVTIVRHIWFKSCWTSLKKHFVTFSILQYLPPLKLLHFPYWTSKIQYNLIKFTSFDVDFLIFQNYIFVCPKLVFLLPWTSRWSQSLEEAPGCLPRSQFPLRRSSRPSCCSSDCSRCSQTSPGFRVVKSWRMLDK